MRVHAAVIVIEMLTTGAGVVPAPLLRDPQPMAAVVRHGSNALETRSERSTDRRCGAAGENLRGQTHLSNDGPV